jgi:hypothetical protein
VALPGDRDVLRKDVQADAWRELQAARQTLVEELEVGELLATVDQAAAATG